MNTKDLDTRLPVDAKDQSGFSLVEMLIAMTLLVIVLGAFYAVAVQTFGIWKKSDKRSEVQQTAQIAIEEIAREARQATQNDNYPVIVSYDGASENNRASIRFYISNTAADFSFIRYRYAPVSKQIIREALATGVRPTTVNWTSNNVVWTGPEVLAEQIENFTFLPASKTFTGAVDDSRKLLLDIEVASASKSYTSSGLETMKLRTRINLRNF